MKKLPISIDPNTPLYQNVGELVAVIRPTGDPEIQMAAEQYMIKFEYQSIWGTIIFKHDAAALMAMNDNPGSNGIAKPSHWNPFIDILLIERSIGSKEVANFICDHFGMHKTSRLYRIIGDGIKFSGAYPLQISAPEGDFKKYLKNRKKVFRWERKFWEPLDETIDLAVYKGK
mgnify:CR=1 FL=1|tara:strand:+ start:312 stop:830 length:519 start_codon:yes stop_codon:yes gene_type:complete